MSFIRNSAKGPNRKWMAKGSSTRLEVVWGVVYDIKTCFYEDLSIDTDSQKVDLQKIRKIHIDGVPVARHGLILRQDGATTYSMLFILLFWLYIALFRNFLVKLSRQS